MIIFSASPTSSDKILVILVLLVLVIGLSQNAAAVVYLDSSDIGTGPYYMETAGETYVLTENISTTGTALVFAASNVTLDLNEFTVTFGTSSSTYRYGVAIPPPYAHASSRWTQSDITFWRNNNGATVKNGSISQASTGVDSCGAIFAHQLSDLTIQDTSLLIYGDDSFGALLKNITRLIVSGNTITDSTTVISNRHQGRAAIDIEWVADDTVEIFDNTIHNCRQWGIRITRGGSPSTWGHIYNNQIYPNAIVTNGYAIGVHGSTLEVYNNTILATTGFGIHIDEDCNLALIHHNTIEVTTEPTWPEYPRNNSHGISLERCTNTEVYNNNVISNGVAKIENAASNGCALKVGINLNSNNYVHDNVFEARHLGGQFFDVGQPLFHSSTIYTDEFGFGDVRIENNTFITQDRFITFYSWVGPGNSQVDASAVVFKGNTWTRQAPTLPTGGYSIFFGGTSVSGLRFVDNIGGDFQNFLLGWFQLPNKWSVGHTGTVKTLETDDTPVPAINVQIRDSQGALIATPTTDGNGEAEIVLDEYSVFTEGSGVDYVEEVTTLNPHEFTALFPSGDKVESADITATGWVTTMRPGPAVTPVANFSGTPLTGNLPLTVTFTDLSSNGPVSWSWNFGDGDSSTLQNPAHTYTVAGTYTVTLVATNSAGSDTETKTAYITVDAINIPVAAFSGTPVSGVAPLSVDFTDLSTNSPTAWSWNFGDGGMILGQNPSHIYTQAGTYTVTLTAANTSGTDAVILTDYIVVSEPVDEPVAGFTNNMTTGPAPLSVTFTDQSSNDPTVWSWNFGDGSSVSLQNPVHTYSSPGTYTVSLTATNAGGSDTETKNDLIVVTSPDLPPVAGFSAYPQTGFAPLETTFADESTRNPTSWFWSFGDGETSTDQNPTHTYAAAGSYSVSLTASNAQGSDTKSESAFIVANAQPQAPRAEFLSDYEQNNGGVPLTVSFTDKSTNDPTNWSWNFGDGGTSTDQNPSYTYDNAGTYTVSLSATNAVDSDTETKVDYIAIEAVPAPPVAEFSGTPLSGISPLAVQFSDLSSNSPTAWSWNFGDGGVSTAQNPSHTYLSAGIFTVSLTVINAGGSDTVIKSNYITAELQLQPPVAGFAGDPVSGIAPLQVSFTDQSTNDPTAWVWNFGDDEVSTEQNPDHTFNNPGSYSVTLTATNASGSDSEVLTEYIAVTAAPTPPTAMFTGNPRTGMAPLTVVFENQSSNNPTEWAWSFGDDEVSTEQNPTHIYTETGVYTVSLTVTNADGSDSEAKAEFITVTSQPVDPVPPDTEFTADVFSGTAPLEINFLDQSTNDPTSWFWLFGDEASSTEENPAHTYTTAGTYTISLTATNLDGSNTETKVGLITITAQLVPPVAVFTATPTSGDAPLTVNFTDQSTKSPTAWSWDFGDGGASQDQNPSHIYSSEGTFSVTLVASNTDGSDSITSLDLVVVSTPQPAPTADFISDVTAGINPLTVQFTDSSLNQPVSWTWSFGDGNISHAQNPSHTYTELGSFSVTLEATNPSGSDSEIRTNYITVVDSAPVAGFTAVPVSGEMPLAVTFTDQSTNQPESWAWSFGDELVSSEQNPSHVFSEEGLYTVTLTVTGPGGSDILTKTGYIEVLPPPPEMQPAPTANFSINQTIGTEPFLVEFTDLSTNDPESWSWDFGDDVFSPSQHPGHSYSAGVYTVSLTVTNEGGSDTMTQLQVITVGQSKTLSFTLAQDMPQLINLSSPEVSFCLPSEGEVRMELYNVDGRRIGVIANQFCLSGWQSITWEPTNYMTGVHFLRLHWQDEVRTKRVVLIK